MRYGVIADVPSGRLRSSRTAAGRARRQPGSAGAVDAGATAGPGINAAPTGTARAAS